MKITFLGTGNAFSPQRVWASVLVNDTILLEAPPSALMSLNHLHLRPADIRHIFISHFHGDHYFGLPFILLDNYFITKTEAKLSIIGPPGIEEKTRQLMELAYPDVIEQGWPRPMNFVEAEIGKLQIVDGVSFSSFPMRHAVEKLKAFGYQIALDDGKLGYSGDTAMTDAIYSLIEGTKVCILEATSQETSPVHLGQQDLLHILDRKPKDCQILLNHLDSPDEKAWQGMDVIVPQDFASYEF